MKRSSGSSRIQTLRASIDLTKENTVATANRRHSDVSRARSNEILKTSPDLSSEQLSLSSPSTTDLKKGQNALCNVQTQFSTPPERNETPESKIPPRYYSHIHTPSHFL
jgi:hypothetical protein